MIAKSLHITDFSCFGKNQAGFDEFKPITVIIGRNNSGKSQLLDLVEIFTKGVREQPEYSTTGSTILTEERLKKLFSENYSEGGLIGNHWNKHGRLLVDASVSWEPTASGTLSLKVEESYRHHNPSQQEAREQKLAQAIKAVEAPVKGKLFRRILADRDIIAEEPSTDLTLSPNGAGSTNVIRRYINSSSLLESLIQQELLSALQEIFGADGDFSQIEIRLHDAEDGDTDYWEVFLGEPSKGLIPLSRSGSGLKTVILVLLNLLVVPSIDGEPASDYVFAFEELENNLHPALLRRLFDFISKFVADKKCYLFLTTHSSVALDYFGSQEAAQIIHVWHDGKFAHAKTVAAHFDRVGLINELGAKPSDLLQANGIIWLEGPSDRVYMNRFIELYSDGSLREGRDYQCAYYGGSVLAKSDFSSPENTNSDLTNLLRLNNNIAVVCDGDRIAESGKGSKIKGRVQRIKRQVEAIDQAFLWITEAKEIENYVPGEVWANVYGKKSVKDPTKHDSFPRNADNAAHYLQKHLGRKSFDKCDFATKAAPQLSRKQLDCRFDLRKRMTELVSTIRRWNE